jgi:hypothetical protein
VSDTDRNPVGVVMEGERRLVAPGDAPGLEAFNALLRRTLALPPKPHSEMKLGKPRGRRPTAPKDTSNRKSLEQIALPDGKSSS